MEPANQEAADVRCSMLSFRAVTVVIIAALIYSVHLYATYHPKIRASTSVWAIGISCTVIADILWITLTRDLNDNALIAHYVFVWEIACDILSTQTRRRLWMELPLRQAECPRLSVSCPRRRMFFPELTSRSWTAPQGQIHSLIPRPLSPLGPVF